MRLQSALSGSLALIAAATIIEGDSYGAIVYNGGICDITNYTNNWWWEGYLIETQADFDATLGNCTTIIGPMFISQNYTGSLVMNNVTNITRDISYYLDNPTPQLASLQADNLVWLSGLDLQGTTGLNLVSMAKLESVDTLTVYSNPALSLKFPQLKNTTDFQIFGGYSSLNLDQLVNVGDSLYIGTTNTTEGQDWEWDLYYSWVPDSLPIDIKLPSLINAPYVNLWGEISSLYMPNLTQANFEISIVNWADQPLNISFPKLSETPYLNIAGNFKNISLPALTNCSGTYTITPHASLALNLNPLREVDQLRLFGNISSVNVSSIQSNPKLLISSDEYIDCKAVMAEWAKATNRTIPADISADGEISGFYCGSPPKPKSHLSKGVQIGIGLAVSIPGLVLFVWCIFWVKKKNAAKQKALDEEREANTAAPGYHLAALDPAPQYTRDTTVETKPEGGENGSPAHDGGGGE